MEDKYFKKAIKSSLSSYYLVVTHHEELLWIDLKQEMHVQKIKIVFLGFLILD